MIERVKDCLAEPHLPSGDCPMQTLGCLLTSPVAYLPKVRQQELDPSAWWKGAPSRLLLKALSGVKQCSFKVAGGAGPRGGGQDT